MAAPASGSARELFTCIGSGPHRSSGATQLGFELRITSRWPAWLRVEDNLGVADEERRARGICSCSFAWRALKVIMYTHAAVTKRDACTLPRSCSCACRALLRAPTRGETQIAVVNFGRPGALVSTSLAFGSGQALLGVPRKALL